MRLSQQHRLQHQPRQERGRPQEFLADLLDPKWRGKLVKAHPPIAVRSSPRRCDSTRTRLVLLRKARPAEGHAGAVRQRPAEEACARRTRRAGRWRRCDLLQLKEQGQPVEPVYASEGTPLITTPGGVFRSAPNPNAARLSRASCAVSKGSGSCRRQPPSVPRLVKVKPGRTPLSAVKLMKCDPATVEAQSEEIKARYTKLSVSDAGLDRLDISME